MANPESSFSAGEKVQVEWNGSWYPAEVLYANEDGSVRIHYDGYDESSDETVPPSRVLRRAETAAHVAQQAPPPGPVANGALEGLLLGNPVTDKARICIGDKMIVEWNGTWWDGEIVGLNADGTVRIHYCGWPTSADETVTRARLQTPAEGRKLVTIHFNPTWALTGSVLKVMPDGLLVSRAEDHKQFVVNRNSVAYVEIHG